MDPLQLAMQYGLPMLTVVVGAPWVAKTLKSKDEALKVLGEVHTEALKGKDEEIARLNDARLKDSQQAGERLLTLVKEFNDLTKETQKSLDAVASHLSRTSPH